MTSDFVLRGGLLWCMAGAVVTLAACAGDSHYVSPARAPIGKWTIENSIDRITGAPLSNSILPTLRVSNGEIPFPPPAKLQLICFKQHPAVFISFDFKIGSTRNTEVGYRFDEKPGHEPRVRIIDDHKSLIIEDPAEVARFVGELATSDNLYVRIRALNAARTSAEFKVAGASDAIKAAYAGCPLQPVAHAGAPLPAERGDKDD
ncbi:MAG: hypothetical protein ACREB8_17935 [Pseudolabrys sp.]